MNTVTLRRDAFNLNTFAQQTENKLGTALVRHPKNGEFFIRAATAQCVNAAREPQAEPGMAQTRCLTIDYQNHHPCLLILSYIVLCYLTLSCIVLCYIILYYIILYYIILYYIILYYIILYYIILYYIILYYIILYYTLSCIILYYIIVYYTILYYVISYYGLLHYRF